MAKLWKESNLSVWISYFNQTSSNIKAKVANTKSKKENFLVKDDEWIWKDLHDTIQSRAPSEYITNQEISRIMRWKLSRGKFRPRLQQLAESNENKVVMETSRKAFSMLKEDAKNGKDDSFYDLKQLREAVKELSTLNGVGPATASLILAAFNQTVPFMADEALAASGLPLKYDISTYIKFAGALQKRCDELNSLVTENSDETRENQDKSSASNDTDEKKVAVERDDDLDLMEMNPFVLSQCLWSFVMCEKFGTGGNQPNEKKNLQSGNKPKMKSKTATKKSENKKKKAGVTGKKRKDVIQSDSGKSKKMETIDSFRKDDDDGKPPKKRRKLNSK